MSVTVNAPVSGTDYHLATQDTGKADMVGTVGSHTHFRCRIFRVEDPVNPVFNQRSDFRDDLNREVLGMDFDWSAGGYYFFIDQPQGQPSAVVAGVFVVTP